MIEWTTGSEFLPIYHVDGELNPADFLTKKHEMSVNDLSTGSVWQTGYPWMELETVDMPLFPYQSLTIPKDVEELIEEECFKEVSPPPEPVTPEMEFPGLGFGSGSKMQCFPQFCTPPPLLMSIGWELILIF